MRFIGQELRELIARTPNPIELHNSHGRRCRLLSRDEALALDLQLFVGIGNRRRLRFLQSCPQEFELNAGSRTTQRLKGQGEVNIAHPLIREHRRVR